MTMAIKAIIFDYGGVLSEEPSLSKFCDFFAQKNKIDPKKFRYTFLENWGYARIGELKADDFWINVATTFNISPRRLRAECIDFFTIREGMLEFVRKLKKNNYKLALISNNIDDLFEETIQKYNLRKYFDVILTSYETKVAKPDLRIYQMALQKIGFKPDEILFIDDMKNNLMPAQKLGMHSVLFTGIPALKTELMMYGIKVV